MVRKNGILGLVVLFVLLLAASSLGVAAAQQAVTPAPSSSASPQYPYLGVRVADTADGITIREVIVQSPAESAGLKAGDTIQKLNGTAVANVSEFATALTALKPGDSAKLDIMRDGKAMSMDTKLSSETAQPSVGMTSDAFNAIAFMNTDKSWSVFGVAERGDLSAAGLKAGDVITAFNGTAYTPSDLQTFRTGLADKDMVKVTVMRDGKPVDLNVPAPALKTFDLFNYANQGILFDFTTATKGSTPAVELSALKHNIPFDVVGYDSVKNAWRVYGLADASTMAAAGLQIDDQITQFDGSPYDPTALQTYRTKLADDTTVKLTVERSGKSMDISVPASVLNSLHMFNYEASGLLFGLADNHFGPDLGAAGLPVNPGLIKDDNLKATEGVVILNISENSAAAAAGLQTHDVIMAVASQKIDTQHTLDSLLATYKPGDKVKLNIMRGDKTMDVEVTLAKPDISGEIPFLIRPL